VSLDTVDEIVAAGADVLVSGSGVFNDRPLKENVRQLKERLK
jgi:pentose-5-phosphate-3-epimerase